MTRCYLERIEKYDPELNTVAEINESAIKQAAELDSQKTDRDAILFGLPLLVKDNIDVAGLHTTAGSMALSDNLAESNAAVVENILHNGGIILGKTNMTEFANFTAKGMPNGYSSRGGFVKNAYDRDKGPSGSSTGSAVAVSAGFCSMAVGTDTSFSIVACATENGIAGLKPRHGSLSPKGIIPISGTLDSPGALSRNLSDAKHRRLEELLDSLRGDGAQFFEVTQPYSPHQFHIMQCEFKRDLEEYLSHSSAKRKTLNDIITCYEADPQSMMRYGISTLREAAGKSTADESYREAMAERARMRSQIVKELEKFDACIMTGPTNIMHFTGLPSLALKMYTGEDGIPRGIILYGADEHRASVRRAYSGNLLRAFYPAGIISMIHQVSRSPVHSRSAGYPG